MTTRTAFGSSVGGSVDGQVKKPVRRSRVGALWQKQTKDGETYFDMEIEGAKELLDLFSTSQKKNSKTGEPIINVKVFINKDKTEGKHPDYRIVLPNPDYKKN